MKTVSAKQPSNTFDICVLGMGYIGVPTAAIFASVGKRVIGVDVLPKRVRDINRGISHIGEADLDALMADVVRRGTLVAAQTPAKADFYIVAVPTPFHKGRGKEKRADMRFVESATRAIAPFIENGAEVILESTSPVGTTENMRVWLKDALRGCRRDKQVDVGKIFFAHCPERILPGQLLKELTTNDRIVGGLTPEAADRAKALYGLFCKGEIFTTNARTAEMAKLTENASRDVSIAFANELSIVCDKLGIDVWELIRLANRHPRVNILNPGPGVGGHCIAVDPWFIIEAARKETPLMTAARNVNDGKPLFVLRKVAAACRQIKKKKPVVACLGLTFKANVNDTRESPALRIVEALAQRADCQTLAVDPHLSSAPVSLKGRARFVSLESALKQADIVLLLVEHREFLAMTMEALRGKVLIDTKGILHG